MPSESVGAATAIDKIKKKQNYLTTAANRELTSSLSRFLSTLPSDDFGIAMVVGSELIRPEVDFLRRCDLGERCDAYCHLMSISCLGPGRHESGGPSYGSSSHRSHGTQKAKCGCLLWS
eukprot:1447780-Amphidinium_carterae.1